MTKTWKRGKNFKYNKGKYGTTIIYDKKRGAKSGPEGPEEGEEQR